MKDWKMNEIDAFVLNNVRALSEAMVEEISVLNWVACLGHSEVDRKFTDPRTGEIRIVPKGQIHFALTTYHYGKDAVWYFGGSKLPHSLAESWKSEITALQKGEQAIFVVKRRVETWEPQNVKFLVFGSHRYELPQFDNGLLLIESLDRPETVSFIPMDLLDNGESFIADLFHSCYFSKNYHWANPHIRKFVPESLPIS